MRSDEPKALALTPNARGGISVDRDRERERRANPGGSANHVAGEGLREAFSANGGTATVTRPTWAWNLVLINEHALNPLCPITRVRSVNLNADWLAVSYRSLFIPDILRC